MIRIAIPFAIVLAAHAARAADCPATAVIEGDGGLVDSIDAQLVRRGVSTTPIASCPVARARIERRGTQVTVIVIDPSGRRSERTLADVDAAASLIESWARQDMNAAALLGWTEPPPVVTEPKVDVAKAAPPPVRERDLVTAAVAGETSIGFDGTPWFGGRATACMRMGPACGGATARVLSAQPRLGFDLIANVDVPYALGERFVVLIGGGIGAGWFRSQYSEGEAVRIIATVGVRLDGHASLSFAFSRYVALHAGVSFGASPQAPVVIDSMADMPLTNGEPPGFFRGDIGLQIGAP